MLQVILQTQNGSIDITEVVTPVSLEENMNKSGVATFGVVGEVVPEEGDRVQISHEGTALFAGRIFKVSFTQDHEIKVTAYDQLRHLKANETYVFENPTADEVLTQICSDYNLAMGEIQPTGHRLGSLIFDSKSLLDIVVECLNNTLLATKRLFFIKDNGGRIDLRDIQTTVTGLVIDPASLLYAYTYERDIDSDTYNQIKLFRDNSEKGTRELFIAKDSANIGKWGLLQYYEKLDDATNEAQAKEQADSLLLLKNRVQQTLSVDVLGDMSLRAGNVVYVDIPDVGVRKHLLCTQAKHTLDHTGHTIKADFKLV